MKATELLFNVMCGTVLKQKYVTYIGAYSVQRFYNPGIFRLDETE